MKIQAISLLFIIILYSLFCGCTEKNSDIKEIRTCSDPLDKYCCNGILLDKPYSCCNGSPFNIEKETCLNGKIYKPEDIGPNRVPCGEKDNCCGGYVYDPSLSLCCNGHITQNNGEKLIQCGNNCIPKGYENKCCNGTILNESYGCCGGIAFNNEEQSCFNGTIYDGPDRTCGENLCNYGDLCCDDDDLGPTCYNTSYSECRIYIY